MSNLSIVLQPSSHILIYKSFYLIIRIEILISFFYCARYFKSNMRVWGCNVCMDTWSLGTIECRLIELGSWLATAYIKLKPEPCMYSQASPTIPQKLTRSIKVLTRFFWSGRTVFVKKWLQSKDSRRAEVLDCGRLGPSFKTKKGNLVFQFLKSITDN